MAYITASITAANTFSLPIEARGLDRGEQDLGVSISGTFVATVTLQRSLDGGLTFHDLTTTYTAPDELNIIPVRGARYRAGVSAGNYTSGTVSLELRI